MPDFIIKDLSIVYQTNINKNKAKIISVAALILNIFAATYGKNKRAAAGVGR